MTTVTLSHGSTTLTMTDFCRISEEKYGLPVHLVSFAELTHVIQTKGSGVEGSEQVTHLKAVPSKFPSSSLEYPFSPPYLSSSQPGRDYATERVR